MNKTNIACIGFIMDGNRRWAKELSLPTFEGHRQGAEVFRQCIEWVCEAEIPHAVFYAFSTENWRRSEDEVSYLMDLFREIIVEIKKQTKVSVRIIGRREDFAEDIKKQFAEIESLNNSHTTTTIWIALSYGGRAEIVTAVNRAVTSGRPVTEESFNDLLWTAEMPDPDIIIRTGGEYRLSNFMTWKSVYSELLFLETYWPALTKDDFNGILKEYEQRERRRGA